MLLRACLLRKTDSRMCMYVILFNEIAFIFFMQFSRQTILKSNLGGHFLNNLSGLDCRQQFCHWPSIFSLFTNSSNKEVLNLATKDY